MKSFIPVDPRSDFPLENLPYGVAALKTGDEPFVAVAIGDQVLNLAYLEREGLLATGSVEPVFNKNRLNDFARLGRAAWSSVRKQITSLLSAESPVLRDSPERRSKALSPQNDVVMGLPFEIPGYTDFYTSENHAANVGRLYRSDKNPLLPNWKHIPIAYNGRASTVVVDGTPVRIPSGQAKKADELAPKFGPSTKMDYELEVGVFLGKESTLGQPISLAEVDDYLFGAVLLNDWSARDIQSWEYQPLGPFLGKSFATTISPWVVTFEALAPFRVPMHAQDPAPLPYLAGPQFGYDIQLTAELKTSSGVDVICETNTLNMYWSFAQQLVHHASNGCLMKAGDLLGSGTLSGPERKSCACLLEATYDGREPLVLQGGEKRAFLEAGDTLTLRGFAQRNGVRVGFGQAQGRLYQA